MTIHSEPSELAGQAVLVTVAGVGSQEFVVVDWWDRVAGQSWMSMHADPVVAAYARRTSAPTLPVDDEVLYVTSADVGQLVHITEVAAAT